MNKELNPKGKTFISIIYLEGGVCMGKGEEGRGGGGGVGNTKKLFGLSIHCLLSATKF